MLRRVFKVNFMKTMNKNFLLFIKSSLIKNGPIATSLLIVYLITPKKKENPN